MNASGFKKPQYHHPQSSALSSIHEPNLTGSKARPLSSKRQSEASILQKLNSSKFKNIQDFEIPNKIVLPQDSRFKYFVLGQDGILEPQKIKAQNQPYKYSQTDDKMLTFSPIKLKHNHSQSSANLKVLKQQKQNFMKRTPSRQQFLNPTQSWIQKITPEKHPQKSFHHNHTKSVYEKQNLGQLTIHEQLYLDSRKKQIKRSAEQIIENEYFKKIHPFKPEVSEVSEFLAEQKRAKIKQRQNFENQFQEFAQWSQEMVSNKNQSKRKETRENFDAQKQKEKMQKQAELKNYAILKQFFCYLSDNEKILSYVNLNPKKLCQLPSACINLIGPILEQFYKNKNTKKLDWLQFLSQFNQKIDKKKTFFSLLEKWFLIKYKLRFNSKSKALFNESEDQNDKIKEQQSTYMATTYAGNQARQNQEKLSKAKLKRLY